MKQCIYFPAMNTPALHSFTDTVWDRNRDDYISTGAYIVYIGRHPIHGLWKNKLVLLDPQPKII